MDKNPSPHGEFFTQRSKRKRLRLPHTAGNGNSPRGGHTEVDMTAESAHLFGDPPGSAPVLPHPRGLPACNATTDDQAWVPHLPVSGSAGGTLLPTCPVTNSHLARTARTGTVESFHGRRGWGGKPGKPREKEGADRTTQGGDTQSPDLPRFRFSAVVPAHSPARMIGGAERCPRR